jgi:hypothetical protein
MIDTLSGGEGINPRCSINRFFLTKDVYESKLHQVTSIFDEGIDELESSRIKNPS